MRIHDYCPALGAMGQREAVVFRGTAARHRAGIADGSSALALPLRPASMLCLPPHK